MNIRIRVTDGSLRTYLIIVHFLKFQLHLSKSEFCVDFISPVFNPNGLTHPLSNYFAKFSR